MSGHVTVKGGEITSNVEFDAADVLRIYGTVAVSNPVVVGTITSGTIASITSGTIASVTDVAQVSHLVTGTLASVTDVAKVSHLVTGTLASVTDVAKVSHLVTGTLASVTDVAKVSHLVTGTLSSVTDVAKVSHLVTGTLSSVTNVASLTTMAHGTVSIAQGGVTALVDSETSALRVIQSEHAEIHEGCAFSISVYDADIDIDGPLNIILKTDSGIPHIRYEYSLSKNGLFELYEGVTVGTLGATASIYNANRTSTCAPTMEVYTAPLGITDTATRLDVDVLGTDSATPAGISGVIHGREDEWILKGSTNYLLKLSASTDNSRGVVKIRWYEE